LHDGNNRIIRKNGAILANDKAIKSTTSNVMEIGRDKPLTSTFQGDLTEVLIYSSVLSINEIRRIESYLMGKYGVSS
jgi:hypothetical protein